MDASQEPGLLRRGVARFVPPGIDVAALPRSFALTEPLSAVRPVPDTWRTTPRFVRAEGLWEAMLPIDAGTHLYGTGEVAGPLVRNGFVTESWAKQPFRIEDDGTPAPHYDERSRSLYQAHPWVLAVRADGSAFGALADTTFRLEIDLRDGIRFASVAPFPLIVVEGATPQAVVTCLADLTGRCELPPSWTLGYHQCRFSYHPDARVREIADELRRRAIPADVIWIDIHYMDAYKVFTFDPEGFPNPRATIDHLRERGFRSIWILDPAVKVEPGYAVYEEGVEGQHFLTDPDGREYHAWTWPGDAAFPDYTRPETRAWWRRLTVELLGHGMDGLWVDLNEPSPILPHGAELPDSLVHRGGGDIEAGDHAQYHNVYGLLMSKATMDAMKEARPEQRPFVLTRSTFLGGQRYAATWTGDNVSDWTHLAWSVPMVLNLGLSGQPNSGPDIGGFAGTPSPELFAHWIGLGALLPFCRTHTGIGSDQEPWSFGDATEETARLALSRRYRLLPYLYTAFHEAATSGLPVARPLFFADPADPDLRSEDRAFLLGGDVLVQPALTPGGPHADAKPPGAWRPFTLVGEDPRANPALPVLRLRPGAILPLGPGGQTAEEAFRGPRTLLVALDEHGKAEGRLYEDEGDGYGYRQGRYRLTTYEAVSAPEGVSLRVVDREGSWDPPDREVRVEVLP